MVTDAKITAKVVSESKRLAFYPKHFKDEHMMIFEAMVFNVAESQVKGYGGGLWDFYECSNGAVYIAPVTPKDSFEVVVPTNYFSGNMSPDAVGVYISMVAINMLLWKTRSEYLYDLYYSLRDFAAQHEESAAIFRALD